MTNKTRKTYTEEFKSAAVNLVFEGKQSVPEASKSLGIGMWNCTVYMTLINRIV